MKRIISCELWAILVVAGIFGANRTVGTDAPAAFDGEKSSWHNGFDKGFHIVTGPVSYDSNNLSLQHWNAVYKHLTEHGFSKKPVMAGAGGAAGEAYAWAIENPDKVSCIYAENPVLRATMSKSALLENLAPLAKAGVPLLHVCGGLDPRLEDNTRALEKRYKDLGGQITVIIKEGEGHYPLAPRDTKAVVEFIGSKTGA